MQSTQSVSVGSGVDAIPEYIAGQKHGEAKALRFNLAANEAATGPNPLARRAYLEYADRISAYPGPDAGILREAIAQHYDLDSERIVTCNGSEEGLHLLARAYVRPGDEVIVSEYGFIVHRIATLASGGVPVIAVERDYHCDLDDMLVRVTDRTRMLLIANPGNPTGTCIPIREIRRLHSALPAHVMLVIDAAYAEFAEERDDYDSGLVLLKEGAKNVVVTRTFSKMYALAGLRVGWMYCSAETFVHLHKVRPTFSVNGAAQAAACAVLGDDTYINESRVFNWQWLTTMNSRLKGMGIDTSDSVANFVLANFSNSGRSADEAFRFLREEGILVRPVSDYGLPDCLRITIGLAHQNEELLSVLGDFMS